MIEIVLSYYLPIAGKKENKRIHAFPKSIIEKIKRKQPRPEFELGLSSSFFYDDHHGVSRATSLG